MIYGSITLSIAADETCLEAHREYEIIFVLCLLLSGQGNVTMELAAFDGRSLQNREYD
ncbi:MAG: hypothetical protein ACM3SR_06630 [Ignavibacteriales bacterium]|jgi:hypothetical protein